MKTHDLTIKIRAKSRKTSATAKVRLVLIVGQPFVQQLIPDNTVGNKRIDLRRS
jgi:hypothetical protein